VTFGWQQARRSNLKKKDVASSKQLLLLPPPPHAVAARISSQPMSTEYMRPLYGLHS
jgi:hypothetical protein